MEARTATEADRRLRDSVSQQIEWETETSSTDIAVNASEGVVTLTGFVHHFAEKLAAERTAKSVYGVKGVANDIEVKLTTMRSDPEMARDILHRMTADVSVPTNRVTVTVRAGVATLDGSVDWNFQRSAAAECANRVHGVRGAAGDVEDKIESALKRGAEIDARRITVTSQNGTVELYGSVHSWFEREQAERAAWSAPGVSEVVIDHIAVAP